MAIAPQPTVERRRLQLTGTVQGVGFRPFVHRLARRKGLGGFVLNDGSGVVIEVEGEPAALEAFADALFTEAPALASVEALEARTVPAVGGREFEILASEDSAGTAAIPPDVATCDACLAELRDPANHRYRYPFINCTECGPRLTIVRRVPYDRASTTMAGFAMCDRCRAEYEDPADRRFHAEPIACPDCGPRLELRERSGRLDATREEALTGALAVLGGGSILAVKGLGGYHLACDAADEDAVARLRARKHREEKPFAVMATSPEALCELDAAESELIRSPERPIVLARRRAGAQIAPSLAPGNPWLGVMLPYTPLHHLLLGDFSGPLVMTSGNRSDEPIAYRDDDALKRIGGIADAFLGHDRPIERRVEDSVVRSAFPVRRSRGLAPRPLPLPDGPRRTIVAAGAELKATFCVAREGQAFLSTHLGDLEGRLAYEAFGRDLGLYLRMLGAEPEVVACDMHPDYLSTRWAERAAERLGAEPVRVQHHHAHAAACLAEHGHSESALALVFDGTGYGPDGTIWGGELLRLGLGSFERLGHLAPVPLPGGERAIREPWRAACAHLERAGCPIPERWLEDWTSVRQSLAVNAPLSSGMGRLFDAVAALLALRERVTYEGQAAIELEWLAGEVEAEPYRCRIEGGVIEGADLLAAARDDLDAGRPAAEIAAAFHEGVAEAATAICAEHQEPRTVVLSGGTFQNLRLLEGVRKRLCTFGFEVLTHRRVPPNDGGISYGQAAVAARRESECA